MKQGKRRRRQFEEDDLTFAGLQSLRQGDSSAISLAVYGMTATITPLDQTDADEGAELVPWPEGADTPILVDRFDCRLLLCPRDLDSRSDQGRTRPSGSVTAPAADVDAVLERERWKDLYNPPLPDSELHYDQDHEGAPFEMGKEGKGSYSASYYSYEGPRSGHAAENYLSFYGLGGANIPLTDLDPPPRPPKFSEEDLADGSLSNLHFAVKGRFPFSAVQWLIVKKTAEFVKNNGQEGALLVQKHAENDPNFAFATPGHVWNSFYLGLVERLPCADKGESGFVEVGTGGKELELAHSDEGGLGALVAGYGSESEEQEMQEMREKSIRKKVGIEGALIEMILMAVKRGGVEVAALVKERLSWDPHFAFLHPESTMHRVFLNLAKEKGVGQEVLDVLKDPSSAVAEGDREEDVLTMPPAPSNSRVFEGLNGNRSLNAGSLPPWILDRMKPEAELEMPRSGGGIEAAEGAVPAPEKIDISPTGYTSGVADVVDESKKAARRKKARLLLEKQERLAEERRKGQAALLRDAEQRREQHLAAISVHKRMFLAEDSE